MTGSKQTSAVTLHQPKKIPQGDILTEWPAAKNQIKRQKTSLGWAYRIYIDGTYMGTGLTQASARDGAKRMLVMWNPRTAENAQAVSDGTKDRSSVCLPYRDRQAVLFFELWVRVAEPGQTCAMGPDNVAVGVSMSAFGQ